MKLFRIRESVSKMPDEQNDGLEAESGTLKKSQFSIWKLLVLLLFIVSFFSLSGFISFRRLDKEKQLASSQQTVAPDPPTTQECDAAEGDMEPELTVGKNVIRLEFWKLLSTRFENGTWATRYEVEDWSIPLTLGEEWPIELEDLLQAFGEEHPTTNSLKIFMPLPRTETNGTLEEMAEKHFLNVHRGVAALQNYSCCQPRQKDLDLEIEWRKGKITWCLGCGWDGSAYIHIESLLNKNISEILRCQDSRFRDRRILAKNSYVNLEVNDEGSILKCETMKNDTRSIETIDDCICENFQKMKFPSAGRKLNNQIHLEFRYVTNTQTDN
jgi:hypothetical protein